MSEILTYQVWQIHGRIVDRVGEPFPSYEAAEPLMHEVEGRCMALVERGGVLAHNAHNDARTRLRLEAALHKGRRPDGKHVPESPMPRGKLTVKQRPWRDGSGSPVVRGAAKAAPRDREARR